MNAEPRRIGAIEIEFEMNLAVDDKDKDNSGKSGNDLSCFLEFE